MAEIRFDLPSPSAGDKSGRQERKEILNALYRLREELRYVLNNLSAENFDSETRTLLSQSADDAKNALAQLDIQAGQISGKVSSKDFNGEEIVSKINQTPSAVSIQANHIQLEGYTTVNGKFAVDANGSMTATGGTIGGWDISNTALNSQNAGMLANDSGLALYAGSDYDGRDGAPFRVNTDGSVVASNLEMTGGSVSLAANDNTSSRVSVTNSQTGVYTSQAPSFFRGYVHNNGTDDMIFSLYNLMGNGYLHLHSGLYGTTALYSGEGITHPRIYGNTTTDGANLNIAPDGTFRRTASSSRRYKRDIQPLSEKALDPRHLLKVPVRQFRYNEGYLKDETRQNDLQIGFIAEELEEIYPAAVIHNADGQPETWNPQVLIPAMLLLIKRLYQKTQYLEGRLEDDLYNTGLRFEG